LPTNRRNDLPEIDSELVPLITNLQVMDKTSVGYKFMKKNAKGFEDRMGKAANLVEIIIQTESAMSKVSELKVKSLMKMFQYLGYVESVGVTLIDMFVLLLIANGHQLHVERLRNWPRILHVSSFKELKHTNLASKLGFLELNEMNNIAKLINRNLRNDIAHINFSIDDKGKIDTSHKNNLDVNKHLIELKIRVIYIDALFKEHKFLEWLKQIQSG
jgi:hypothetical protein